MNKTDIFIDKCQKKHGDRYDYSKTLYVNNTEKVIITCRQHGDFLQQPAVHIRGSGCKKCHTDSLYITEKEFIDKCQKKHGDRYDYSNTKYQSSSVKISINCQEHGTFVQWPYDHLNGRGCPSCSYKLAYSTEQFIEQSDKIHSGQYDYSKTEYKRNDIKTIIICKEHGEFLQTPSAHLKGYGCQLCGKSKRIKQNTKNTEQFIKQAKEIHGDMYNYSATDYTGSLNYVDITCKRHGIFSQLANNHLQGHGCMSCSKENFASKPEYEIKEFIESLGFTVEHTRQMFGIELDLYVPDKKLAIEYNGLFYHSSGSSDNDAKIRKKHINKTEICEKNDIQLLHIFENEWLNKKDIWKSTIISKLGKSIRIFARKTQLKEISSGVAKEFCDQNHLQGYTVGKYNYGLFLDNNLVSVMVIGKPRYSSAEYEILRYCNKINHSVIGGFSKILSYFSKFFQGKIISYANRRWSNGKVYKSNNFRLSNISDPCYYYIKGDEIYHRSLFMKHLLSKKLVNYDSSISESKNMYNNKYRRIWDCGNLVYEMTL